MSFFTWNLRGFNKSRKHSALRHWVQAAKPDFGCLLETRVQEKKFDSILTSALPGWSAVTNYRSHRLGRIWVCWSQSIEVTVYSNSPQQITCLIRDIKSSHTFFASFVYASNFASDRRLLWADLLHIYRSIPPAMPWIIVGDFNETLALNEHSQNHCTTGRQQSMYDFQNVVIDCGLADLAYQGSIYTWWNNQTDNPIGKKLDRALMNDQWLTAFPNSYATFEAGGVSDHAPCVVRYSAHIDHQRRPFKFFNYMTKHTDFQSTVASEWTTTEALFQSRCALYRFHKKQKGLKCKLRALNRETYGNLQNRTVAAFAELCQAQENQLHHPTSSNQILINEASTKWNHLNNIEEQFHRQKSRIQWLREGDQNTTVFHKVAEANASRNAIRTLTSTTGIVLTNLSDIKLELCHYFQDFLQATPAAISIPTQDRLTQILSFKSYEATNKALVTEITTEEIKRTLFSILSNKAHGPDGFTTEFYKAAWDIIGPDFVTAIKSFFNYGFLPKGLNATILTLIPKTSDATNPRDYRPIACCNTIYKVISKIIANRLKGTLPEMIEKNQSAFVGGRLLLENILLATELVKDYHRDSISTRAAMKLDLSKAFDTIQWPFILAVLEAMNIPALFIRWIEVCLTTASFSVSVNGELEGFFTANCGLRQGCSLSPSLFVIISNVLSCMLNIAAQDGAIGYHPKCRDVGITHLSFADDIMIFFDGRKTYFQCIMAVLREFGEMSGLHINPMKSELFASGKDKHLIMQAATNAGIQLGSLPIRYLGLPLTTRSMTQQDYLPLIDRIRNRFLTWASKHLSFAGRLELIKSVIASISNFWCSVFRLPKRCLQAIESMCNAYLWSGSPNQHHKTKVSWKEITTPTSEGGLGIRRLKDTSRIYALSLIWRIISGKILFG